MLHIFKLRSVYNFLRIGRKSQQIAGQSDKIQILTNTSTESSKQLGVVETKTLLSEYIEGSSENPGVLKIGENSEYLSIGNKNSNTSMVEIFGKTINTNIINNNVEDKSMTVNLNGIVNSGGDSGIDVEEDGIIQAWFRTAIDRNGWVFKSLNKLGLFTIQPSDSNTVLRSTATANQVLDLPNVPSGTLSTQENAETLENKTLIDESTFIKSRTEDKKFRFNSSLQETGQPSIVSPVKHDVVLNTKINWDNNTKYVIGETVIFNLLEYRALTNIPSVPIEQNPKIDTSNWELLGVGDADLYVNKFRNGLL